MYNCYYQYGNDYYQKRNYSTYNPKTMTLHHIVSCMEWSEIYAQWQVLSSTSSVVAIRLRKWLLAWGWSICFILINRSTYVFEAIWSVVVRLSVPEASWGNADSLLRVFAQNYLDHNLVAVEAQVCYNVQETLKTDSKLHNRLHGVPAQLLDCGFVNPVQTAA